MGAFLQHQAAARDIADNGFHARLSLAAFHQRPPGVDQGAQLFAPAALVVHVKTYGAAAALLRRQHGLDACRIEHAGGGGIDAGLHGRLHAVGMQQDSARMVARRPAAGRTAFGHLGTQGFGQQSAHGLAHPHGGRKQGRGQAFLQRPAQGALGGRAGHALVHQPAADIDQMAVLHATRAGGFAVAAGQATVQMQLGGAGRRPAFQHLLHQIDAAARTVQLVAKQLVGGAGGVAEAAVHALAQDGFRLAAFGRVGEFGGKRGLHGVSGTGW